MKLCERCGIEFAEVAKVRRKRFCSERCRSIQYYETHLETIREYKQEYSKANLESLREKKREYYRTDAGKAASMRAKEKRRALKLGAFVGHVDRQKIFERDKYTCQLCGEIVNMNKKHPDSFSPSLDHIIPLSGGGTHEPDNVQLAHFRCNLKKSRGGAP